MTAINCPARKARQQVTRHALLTAALDLFESVGYEAAVMRDIADKANVSTGAIFSNFKDKAALYREVYGHRPVTAEEGRVMKRLLGVALKGRGLDLDQHIPDFYAMSSELIAKIEAP